MDHLITVDGAVQIVDKEGSNLCSYVLYIYSAPLVLHKPTGHSSLHARIRYLSHTRR
jgi:hypothetical protein